MTTFPQQIAETVKDMIYIGESEAPLELMDWPAVKDLLSLQDKIASEMKIPVADQTVIKPDEFLDGIHQMADPADKIMVQYAMQYDTLFDQLKAGANNICVIRAGEKTVHFFIAAFSNDATVIIHTTSVES